MKKLKTIYYYIIAFFLLFIFILRLFYVVYENHRNTVVEQQNDQLGILANVGTRYLKTYVDEKNLEIQNMFTIKDIGKDPVLIERKVEEIIKLYWNQSPIYLDYMKYFTVDELKNTRIFGLSDKAIESYTIQALKNNEIIIGPFAQINSNNMGIYLFKGIFNEYGKYGVLVCRVNLSMVFHSTISNIQVGNEGYLTLSDIDENFIYYGNQEGLFFTSVKNNSLNRADYLKGYSFTEVGDLNLLISARLPFKEIEKPIQITFYLLLSLSIGLLILFSIFTYVLFHFQKKELAYSMDLKIQEQLHQGNRNEVLGLFSRKIAHDYNNLLTPITIYCELLEDSLTDSELLDYVNEIKKSSEQCMLLAKELLEYGRNQPSHSQTIHYDSTLMLQDTLKRIQLLLTDSIKLKTDISIKPLYLDGQPLEFVQIIYNLCMNSIHAMEGVKNRNHVLSIIYKQEKNQAVLTINDTGNGIPKHLQSKIFTTQFTTKSAGRGNGLGLAIVSEIVEKYNGTINFQSVSGKGTTFTLAFPLSTHFD